MGVLARFRSLLRGLLRRSDVESEVQEEFRQHIELRAADLMRDGMSPDEARRRAHVEFGHAEGLRDEARASRGLKWFDGLHFSWLDVKLGLRMLRRYPGMTVTAGLALAFAIGVGASTFEIITQVVSPRLPLDEGDRVVRVSVRYGQDGRIEPETLADFAMWRDQVQSIKLGAYIESYRTLVGGQTAGDPVLVAETTASAFSIARVPPLLGRPLIPADEEPGAPPVAVIGYDLWRSRFAGDSTVVGRNIVLGGTRTIVGVMPDGFGFPIWHAAWMPLRVSELASDPARAPGAEVFGRLAAGATVEEAQAELATVGLRTASAVPGRSFRNAGVDRYALGITSIISGTSSGVAVLLALSTNLLPLALLALICANVALLVFARTVAREGEIVVRTALGATRRRIVTQLFTEALVLGTLAAVLGLAVAGVGVGWTFDVMWGEILEDFPLPFWFHGGLSGPTVVYAGVLGVLAAVVAGVVPALKVTGGIGGRLKETSAGGGGVKLGGAWTAVIVVQVAVSVVVPAVTLALVRGGERVTPALPFPVEEYVGAALDFDPLLAGEVRADAGAAELAARYGAARAELERRLLVDPEVSGVTFSRRLPLQYHPWNQIEVDGGAIEPPDERGHRVGVVAIEPDYFEVLGVPLLVGRGFTLTEAESGAQVAIVNQPFVENVLGGGSPIGRHVRILANEDAREPRFDRPWYEIVGVAPSLGTRSGYGFGGIYVPSGPEPASPTYIVAHVRGDAPAFGPRLQELALDVDQALTLTGVMTLDRTTESDERFSAFWIRIATAVSVLALSLSLAGIYSVFSFTVARRTREIGIRVALGADAKSVVASVFARPLFQVVLGGVLGGIATYGLGTVGEFSLSSAVGVLAYVALTLAICLLACVVPARRALRIEPSEALRAE
ncbi:MAG: ABC transporter permease [Gemmatimonadota bacterium]